MLCKKEGGFYIMLYVFLSDLNFYITTKLLVNSVYLITAAAKISYCSSFQEKIAFSSPIHLDKLHLLKLYKILKLVYFLKISIKNQSLFRSS